MFSSTWAAQEIPNSTHGVSFLRLQSLYRLTAAHGTTTTAAMRSEAAAAGVAAALGVRMLGAVEELRCLDEYLDGGLGRRCGAQSTPCVHMTCMQQCRCTAAAVLGHSIAVNPGLAHCSNCGMLWHRVAARQEEEAFASQSN